MPGRILADADLGRRSQDYRFRLLAGPAGIPSEGPLKLEGGGFCFSALKGAEDGDGCILRLYNPSAEVGSVAISVELSTEPCRLDEAPDDAPFTGSILGGHIASLILRPRAQEPELLSTSTIDWSIVWEPGLSSPQAP